MAPTRTPLRDAVFGGAVAQLGERLVRNEEVRGSTPLGSTTPKTTDGWFEQYRRALQCNRETQNAIQNDTELVSTPSASTREATSTSGKCNAIMAAESSPTFWCAKPNLE